jgi:hypothetical protein
MRTPLRAMAIGALIGALYGIWSVLHRGFNWLGDRDGMAYAAGGIIAAVIIGAMAGGVIGAYRSRKPRA